MEIRKITENKKQYLQLLLIADESEKMINKYLEKGEMFVLDDDGIKGECVVTRERKGIYEIKNLAIYPKYHKLGYGRMLINYVLDYYNDCDVLLVGTGDVPSTLTFYHKCGFEDSHRKKNFFIDNYDEPIIDEGIQLVDMVYLKIVKREIIQSDKINEEK